MSTPSNPFKKATKKAARLRLGLIGPPGSGKTFTSLMVASAMARILEAQNNREAKIAVIDTEYHSAEKYADVFDFETHCLEKSFHPKRYIDGIRAAEDNGFDFLIIDSLSHAWIGTEGGLDLHDKAVARQKTKNSFTAWAEVTPHHMALVQALLQCRCHLIVTLRSKVEYVQETVNGKTTVRKVGTAPLMRDGLEYEFDVVGDMDDTNSLVITKTRCRPLKRAVIQEPGQGLAETLMKWLSDGAPEEVRPAAANGNGVVLGLALLRRITMKDDELAKRSLCKLGDLIAAVKRAGEVKGFGRNIEEWPEEGFHLAVAETRAFEAKLKPTAEAPRQREPGEDG